MAIRRSAPTNPLGGKYPILTSAPTTYSLAKRAKGRTLPQPIRTEDQRSIIKADLMRTLLVSALILGIILFAVEKLK